ncbi:ThuA domain-containing protein [Ktedonobacter racemifer]|uniref:Crp/FNR family transcriptional regulator n=1 Tax=Ktedonobacter racemifer DSM 44963 TaxID=485913 RepID=D6TV49_KTERA|nr:ThuA domain-containing protein [Ktedonobacter racemifer]EFH84149.1 Crp/FNR family transcriptional regulator [Ktedonobacter racemifer DSM 44963]
MRSLCCILLSIIVLTSCGTSLQLNRPSESTPASSQVRLLIFSRTTGFRHASIPDGIASIKQIAAAQQVAVDATEDASTFTPANLMRYRAIIFLSTSGNVLDAAQKAAFEGYIRAGGGYVGIHSASDTEYNWPWYGQLVGAYFKSHPSRLQLAHLTVEERHHPSTAKLPRSWTRVDEWYNFRSNPRSHVHVLLTIDETSYQGGEMNGDHPISWYHTFDGGRAWYTAMGHTSASFAEPLFRAHLWGGILYAAGLPS